MDLILQFGYLGLFVITFLSASVLPLASEAVVIAMPALGFNVWLILIVATAACSAEMSSIVATDEYSPSGIDRMRARICSLARRSSSAR